MAEGLVELAGTDVAATELDRLFGRDRAMEALCRTATADPVQDDVGVTLDLTGPEPVVDLRDSGSATDSPAASQTPSSSAHRATRSPREWAGIDVRERRVPAAAGRSYWL